MKSYLTERDYFESRQFGPCSAQGIGGHVQQGARPAVWKGAVGAVFHRRRQNLLHLLAETEILIREHSHLAGFPVAENHRSPHGDQSDECI